MPEVKYENDHSVALFISADRAEEVARLYGADGFHGYYRKGDLKGFAVRDSGQWLTYHDLKDVL